MIIKVNTISSSHGHNAIEYAMNKKMSDKEKPEFLASAHLPVGDILGPVDSTCIWESMKRRQANSGHKIKDGFFRIEICPPMEECRNWSMKDWEKLLQDSIRHLDSTDFLGKSGNVIGKHTDIAHSQWIATIHRDTDNYHIHLIANRINENNEVQDDTRCRNRGVLAANKLAEERGWIKAQDRQDKRKVKIHADAIDVLRHMEKYCLEEYFKGMQARGWKIDAKYDNSGICRGYSIGQNLYKANGSLSSTIMYQSSKLGFGRDLMVSRLEGTWKKLHPVQVKASEKNNMQDNCTLNSLRENWDSVTSREPDPTPKWKCSNRMSQETWRDEGTSVRIPDVAFDTISNNIQSLGRYDYYDRDEDIPAKMQIVAVAVFEFCTAANVYPSSGGGGGGSDNDLRWDGKTEDELQQMAAAAAHKAIGHCTSHLTKRKRGLGR